MFHPHVLDASEVEVHHSVGLDKILVSNLFPIFNLCHILISYLILNFVKKKSWSIAVPVLPSEIELEGMSNTISQKEMWKIENVAISTQNSYIIIIGLTVSIYYNVMAIILRNVVPLFTHNVYA